MLNNNALFYCTHYGKVIVDGLKFFFVNRFNTRRLSTGNVTFFHHFDILFRVDQTSGSPFSRDTDMGSDRE